MILVTLCSLLCMSVFNVWSLSLDYILFDYRYNLGSLDYSLKYHVYVFFSVGKLWTGNTKKWALKATWISALKHYYTHYSSNDLSYFLSNSDHISGLVAARPPHPQTILKTLTLVVTASLPITQIVFFFSLVDLCCCWCFFFHLYFIYFCISPCNRRGQFITVH